MFFQKYKKIKVVNGFSIAEMLIALTITAVLLTAVAIAFNASLMNYGENQDMYKAINNARQALFRITTELRTASSVVYHPGDPNSCTLDNASSDNITFEYRANDQQLYLVNNDTVSEYLLCEDITAMSFVKNPTQDNSQTKSVLISMTVQSGNAEQTLAAAAVVRKVIDQ